MANWAEQLNEWMKSNNVSKKALCEKTGIKGPSLYDYTHGRAKMPDKKRKILYESTNLEILANPVEPMECPVQNKGAKETVREKSDEKNENLYNDILDLEAKVTHLKNKYAKPTQKTESFGKIKKIESIFYNLLQEMEYLKSAPSEEREKLTKSINSKDMGYFISFINAIYKPDQFNMWVRMSGYIPTKRKKD